MDSHGHPVDEAYPPDGDPSYLSYSISDDPRHNDITVSASVQVFDLL